MKKFLSLSALVVALTVSLNAAAPVPKVTGKMDIQFQTRTQVDDSGRPNTGIMDQYKLDLAVTDSLLFQGGITHLPVIFGSVLGTERQQAALNYDLNLSVRNPANPAVTKAIGKLVGSVPIDKKGVYQYGNGTLRIAVDAMGKASEFTSAFRGQALGKPPKGSSLLDRATQQAVSVTKVVKGQTKSIVVTKYDKMTLNGMVLAAGPVKIYPETQVNGEMLYDYERSAWYFRGVSLSYQVDGKTVTDKVSGNIKWVESPQRKTTGEGEYQFDVRVNEPEAKQAEAAVFAPADNEASFFEADATLAALVGSAKYKDTMSGDTVTASAVTIDLTGNNLSKLQVVNLTKLIWIVCVVPVNAE
jgi:hypothetical protein